MLGGGLGPAPQKLRGLRGLRADQAGVTGLETAIILIAFVVVASIFAFTLLSTGLFSAERSKETIHAGLTDARSTLAPTSGVIAYGLTKDIMATGDTLWTSASTTTVTSTIDTTDKKRGVGSVKLVVQTAFTTGLAAYENRISSVNLTNQTQLRFWVKSSTSTAAGQIEIVLDEDTGCASPEAHIDVPALSANIWTLVTAAITQSDGTTAVTNANKDAVACIGLEVETDLSTVGDITIHLDDLVGSGILTRLVFNITLSAKGEAINLATPTDADEDGQADSDGRHTMTVSYFDHNQLVRDVYWTINYLGDNDGDTLLETGERAEISIFLSGLADATPLTRDMIFSVELKPSIGSVMVLRRKTPSNIDLVMPLD